VELLHGREPGPPSRAVAAVAFYDMPVRQKLPDVEIKPGPVKVYLDDLKEIDRILRGIGDEVRLQAETFHDDVEYELTGLAELEELPGGDVLRRITWSRGWPKPAFWVALAPRWVAVTGDAELRGPLEQVADVLRRRRRRLAHAVTRSWIVSGLLGGAMGGTATGAFRVDGAGRLVWFGGLIVAVCGYAAVTWAQSHKTVIVRQRRLDHPPFWERKRDELIVLAISVVLTAVVSGVVGFLLGRA
jgi:hypothetical protein